MSAPDLQSTGTFQIAGRGTIKAIHPDAIPKGYTVRVGDPVRIDGADWICVGIESRSHPDGSIGVLVRPAGDLASIPVGACEDERH